MILVSTVFGVYLMIRTEWLIRKVKRAEKEAYASEMHERKPSKPDLKKNKKVRVVKRKKKKMKKKKKKKKKKKESRRRIELKTKFIAILLERAENKCAASTQLE